MASQESGAGSIEPFAVESRRHRRTALVALKGEFDRPAVAEVAATLAALKPAADGVRHIVLDLRGLTFMDVGGLRELLRQNEFARANHHNLAVVRPPGQVQRLLKLAQVDEQFVMVEDPEDLVPPPAAG